MCAAFAVSPSVSPSPPYLATFNAANQNPVANGQHMTRRSTGLHLDRRTCDYCRSVRAPNQPHRRVHMCLEPKWIPICISAAALVISVFQAVITSCWRRPTLDIKLKNRRPFTLEASRYPNGRSESFIRLKITNKSSPIRGEAIDTHVYVARLQKKMENSG